MPWKIVSKKKNTTITSFLIIYDNNFNYIESNPFYSYNGCQLQEVKIDKMGNIFMSGHFQDSLQYNGKLVMKNKSIYGYNF